MIKKAKYILGATLCAIIVIVGVWLILRPKSTPVNANFQTTILDANGVQIGTTTIELNGYKTEYISKKSYLNVDISSLDGFTNIQPDYDIESKKAGLIVSEDSLGFDYVVYSADQEDLHKQLILYFSPNMERWLISIDSSDADAVYYIGSASVSDSIEDLKAFFAPVFAGQ